MEPNEDKPVEQRYGIHRHTGNSQTITGGTGLIEEDMEQTEGSDNDKGEAGKLIQAEQLR